MAEDSEASDSRKPRADVQKTDSTTHPGGGSGDGGSGSLGTHKSRKSVEVGNTEESDEAPNVSDATATAAGDGSIDGSDLDIGVFDLGCFDFGGCGGGDC